MLVLYYDVFYQLKAHEIEAEKYLIPRNMSFAVLWSSLLIHSRFSFDIYSRTFYEYSLSIMHYSM